MDSIAEYRSFLKPLLSAPDVAFCTWYPGERRLENAVPELAQTVARQEEWRTIVLCDERGLVQRNPFVLVPYAPPQRSEGEADSAYFPRLFAAKCSALDAAAEQPLTRLMAHLCESPLTSGGKNDAEKDPEFAEYQAEAAYKRTLREQIVDGEDLGITLPAEILCVAKRTCTEETYDLHSSWTPHVDHQYSRFYDWNLYFDKMRYLVFDILPKHNQNYAFDYIRFLYAVLLLANHPAPQGSLRPRRIYSLACENDEGALRALLASYEGKLLATDELLAQKLRDLTQKQRPRLSDQEADAIFCGKVTVPISIPQEFDESELYVSSRELGLSTDCPTEEYALWERGYLQAQKSMHRFLKLPRRAVKRAAGDLRTMGTVDSDRVRDLNAFQIEDIAEHVADEELSMVATATADFSDTARYKKEMESASRAVRRKIETRMTRRTTVLLGVLVLVLYLVGFLPLVFTNLGGDESKRYALFLLLGAVGLLAAVGIVCLFCLRSALKQMFRRFNDIMHGLVLEVSGSMMQFSKYLSHACNVMRGFSVLNEYAEQDDPESRQAKIYRKHRMDILRCREELREVFGRYLSEETAAGEEEPYDYDFTRPVDFVYPMPYTERHRACIDFMQTGNEIAVPVPFVQRITVRMEELYD